MGEDPVAIMEINHNAKSRCGVNCKEKYSNQFFHVDLLDLLL